MLYRFFALSALFAYSFAFAKESDQIGTPNKESKQEFCCKKGDFEFDIHGEEHFSMRYVKNEDYFKIKKGSNLVDVLVGSNGDTVLNPIQAIGIAKKSDGGLMGDYSKEFDLVNSFKVILNTKKAVNDDVAYGASGEIKFETDSTRKSTSNNGYLYLDTIYGRFEGGHYKSAAEIMKIDASTIATIDEGIDNDWVSYANVEGRHINAKFDANNNANNTRNRDVLRPFYTLPYLYTAYYRNYVGGGHRVKMTYYSPGYSGFNFGITYTANEVDTLPFNGGGIAEKGGYKNVISGGLVYDGNYENVKFKISATGEKSLGDDHSKDYFDLNGFNIGGIAGYAGFKFAASFANVFKSGLAKNPYIGQNLSEDLSGNKSPTTTNANPGNTIYWTLGTSYEAGPAMASITYLRSKTDPINKDSGFDHENILNVISLGTHYNIDGNKFRFTPYIALNYFKTHEGDVYNPVQKSENNSGYVFLAGTKVKY